MRALMIVLGLLSVSTESFASERTEQLLREAARVVLVWDDAPELREFLADCAVGVVENTFDEFPSGALGAIALVRGSVMYRVDTVVVVQYRGNYERGSAARATLCYLRCT